MSNDPEIEAMGVIVEALDRLQDDETRGRVLRWAGERFNIRPLPSISHDPIILPTKETREESNQNARQEVAQEKHFEDFIDLFDAVDPKNDLDRVITGAYWLQVIQRQSTWQSVRINNQLKDTGHGVANVTTVLTSAQKRKPALVRQVSKSGKAKQARKTYKLTTSGVSYIRSKLGLSSAVPAALADSGEDDD